MKNIYSLVVVFSLIFSVELYSQSGWHWINPYPFEQDFQTIQFADQSTGYAIITNKIYKTTDGGANWIIPGDTVGYSTFFNAIDENIIYSCGNNKIYKTTDGGISWVYLQNSSSGTSYNYKSLKFFNALTGFACGTTSNTGGPAGCIKKTSNGGNNWLSLVETQLGFSDICVYGTSSVIVTGYDTLGQIFLYKSDNLGLTWNMLNTGVICPNGTKLFIADILNYFILTPGGIIYKSSDGGANWQLIQGISNINNLYIYNYNNIYAAGNANQLIKSTDGGNTWQALVNPLSNYNYYSLTFINNNTGWVSGTRGSLLKTTNAGLTWASDANTLTTKKIYDVQILNNNVILLAAADGLIYRTSDQGSNWATIISNSNNYSVYNLFFTDEVTGFASGASGLIMSTTNSGNSWAVQQSNTNNNLYDLFFTNYDTGFAVGQNGCALKTTNSGSNWISINFTSGSLYTVKFINGSTGFIGSVNDNIYKTIDCGNTWTLKYTSAGQKNITDIGFFNNNEGIAIDNSGYIMRTISGGDIWTQQSQLSSNSLNKLKIVDSVSAYIIKGEVSQGSASKIYYTSNKGISWGENVVPFYPSSLLSIDVYNRYLGFIVGDNGVILKTSTGGTISDGFSISGKVRYIDNNQPVTSGSAKAIKYTQNFSNIIIIDSSQIQPNGDYILAHVSRDSVDIGIYPNSTTTNDYVISYYSSTIYWENATLLYPTHNLTNVDIYVYRNFGSDNPNQISGKITSANKDVSGNLKDAVIYARKGDTFVGCTMSDANGNYQLNSLAEGNLKIFINRFGYISDSTYLNVTPTSNIDSVNFNMMPLFVGLKQISSSVPNEYKLYQNYPNPFNPMTNIKYQISKAGFVILKIYDILGRQISTLINEKQTPGSYNVTFDATSLSSGVYFYKLQTDNFTDTKKMVIIK